MNLLLDDFRNEQMTFQASGNTIYLKEKWVIVKNYDEFVKFIIDNPMPKLISFDHDLSDEHYGGDYSKEMTGKDCADFLVNFCIDKKVDLPKILIHSQNPGGKLRIDSVFKTYYKYFDKI